MSALRRDHADHIVYHRSDGYRQDTEAHRVSARRCAASALSSSHVCLFAQGQMISQQELRGGLDDIGPPAIRRHAPSLHDPVWPPRKELP